MPDTLPSYRSSPPKRVGGLLCLDFANTVSWRGDPRERGERLGTYAELVYWAVHAGALSRGRSQELLAEAGRRPDAAERVLARAVELREAVVRLVRGRGRGADADVAIVNRMLAAAPPRTSIAAGGTAYTWTDVARGDLLEAPLHPVTWSAVELLTSDRRKRVQRCGDARCGWLFLDTSPTGRRRWCSMEGCGNRAKARRHHHRVRAG